MINLKSIFSQQVGTKNLKNVSALVVIRTANLMVASPAG